MKNKDRLAFKLALVLTIFAILGCQGASQLFPTPTPVFTSTPTITPSPTATLTLTPTLTPTPLPDISMVKISLSELPAGFEELSPAEMGIDKTTIANDTFKPEAIFVFVNSRHLQMIIGMNFFVAEKMDRVGFDIAMNQPEIALKQMTGIVGASGARDEKVLPGFEDIGDVRFAMSMVADMNNVPMLVEILMFRRDIIGGMIISITIEGQTSNISLHDLGTLFDQHVQENLK